jgi:hypothetical protein
MKALGTTDATKLKPAPDETPPPSPDSKIGANGVAVFGGYVDRKETDARLLGQTRYKTFSELVANISIVAAGVRYFLNLVAKPEWKAEPNPSGAAGTQEAADFVQEVMDDMDTSWHRVVRRASMYKFYGFGIQEWTAKLRDDGKIGLLDVEARGQSTIERWDMGPHGEVLGCWQAHPESGEELYLPRNKVVYMLDDSIEDGPEGLGLFRHCADPGARLRRIQELEMIGFETDLRGIPVGRAPLGAIRKSIEAGKLTEEQATALLAPLRSIVENHVRTADFGLLIDSMTYVTADESSTPSGVKQWDLQVLKGGSVVMPQASEAIMRITGEIARILGVDWLLLGTDGKGSLALARDKSQQFGLIVDSAIKEIRQQITRDLLKPLWMLNGWPKETMPKLKVAQIQYRDIEQITGSLVDMAQAGAMLAPDDPALDAVRELLGLPAHIPYIPPEDLVALGNEPKADSESGGAPEPDPVGNKPEPPERKDIPNPTAVSRGE